MPLVRPFPLAAAALILAGLWLTPMAGWGQSTFTGHMVLHMTIVGIAAPLLVLGLPGAVAAIGRLAPPILTAPLAAAVEFVVVWGWHAPAICRAVQSSDGVFVAEQASWVSVGVLLWAAVLQDWQGRGLALWTGVLALLLTAMHMTFLGALISVSAIPLYGRPLIDQQIGGLVMLAVGGIVYTLAGIILAARGLSAGPGRTDGAAAA